MEFLIKHIIQNIDKKLNDLLLCRYLNDTKLGDKEMLEKFSDDFEVCACMSITLKEIVDAIKKYDLKSVEEIMDKTEAGTACGSCVSLEESGGDKELHLDEILKAVRT